MKTAISFLFATSCFAQASLVLTGPATVLRGQTATLPLNLTGSSGVNLSGIQWTYGGTFPVGVTLTTAVGAAATAAGKGLVCGLPGIPCEEIGRLPVTNALSNNPMADGVVASVSMAVAATVPLGTYTVSISGMVAADTSGKAQVLTTGSNYSFKVITTALNNCDINSDGVVDFQDVALVGDAAVGRIPCTFTPGCTLGNAVAMILAAMPPSPTNPLQGVCPF